MADKKETDDIVVQISTEEEAKDANNHEVSEFDNLRRGVSRPASPDTSRVTAPTAAKPPKVPITRKPSLARSAFSKPKSRFAEPISSEDPKLFDQPKPKPPLKDTAVMPGPTIDKAAAATPKDVVLPSTPRTSKTPLIGTPGREEEDDEEPPPIEEAGEKWKFMVVFDFFLFVFLMGCLIASLTVDKLQSVRIWSLELWKWFVLILVIFSGRLVTGWSMNIIVFLVERNFLLRKKVLYFVYGVKKSIQVFLWFCFVLLAWGLLFNRGVERPKETEVILSYITTAIAGLLVGAAIWLVKTLLIKMLASSFHVKRFFDRIQESIFHQHVLRTLSRPQLVAITEKVGTTSSGQSSFRNLKKGNEELIDKEGAINIEKLKTIKREKVSAWTMKRWIHVIRGTGLSTIAIVNAGDGEQKDEEINSEWEAKVAAYRIFKNVAKPGHKYIEEEDLLRFMKKEEVDNVIPLFEGAAETRKIKRSALKNWLVNIYLERKSLAHSLNDTKTAIKELNKLVSVVTLLVIAIVWLLMMGFLTTKILVLLSSQLLILGFVFNSTAKNVFEAIIFVFVMHPFDVGDRCVIDGVHMVVEEMNILTTVFLRYDNEKIFYPNSVLAMKPISNFYRSPEMSDSVEFAVDISTSVEQIGAIKERIKAYLESKPKHWRPGFSLTVKEIENVNKMKMGLSVNHTINFQNYGDKSARRSDLLLELKRIFEEVGIKYHLLPQEVHVSYAGAAAAATAFAHR